MLSTDTSVTRKLKHDINQKNEIRKDIEKRVKTVSQWKDRLESSKSFQKQNKYTTSIKRYIAEIECLRIELNQTNEDLDKRIREVGEFSASEIDAFNTQIEQKINELNSQIEQKVNKIASKNKPKKAKGRRDKVIEEAKSARKKIAELKSEKRLQEKIEKARNQLSKDIEDMERVTGKIIKMDKFLENVKKDGGPAGEELTPKENDNYFFTQEIKRITREKAVYL